jgi:predicted ATPase
LTGELAIARGDPVVGEPLLRCALREMEAVRYHTLTSAFRRALAEGLLQSGDVDDAVLVIDGALARSEPVGLPELLRVRGKIWLEVTPEDPISAELAFQRSLEQAKAQSALSLELRSAVELARLWSNQGKTAAAADLLASVRKRFTEGFQTADLKRADRLLAALRQDGDPAFSPRVPPN